MTISTTFVHNSKLLRISIKLILNWLDRPVSKLSCRLVKDLWADCDDVSMKILSKEICMWIYASVILFCT